MTPPQHKWWSVLKTILSSVLGLAILGAFLAWMGGAFHTKVQPGSITLERLSAKGRSTVVVEKQRSDDLLVAVGSVQPRRRTDVAGQLLARILEVKVRPGERVQTGDVLVVLDARELITQQRDALAAARAAEADLIVRKQDVERAKAGAATGAVTREDFERLKGAVLVGDAQVERAKEQISRLEVQLSYTKILAATPGIIADRFADPGDLAQPGKPLLSMHDPAELELHVSVPESQLGALAEGKNVPIQIDAANFRGTATVREIVPQAQQASRTVLVKVAIPSTTSTNLLAGMFGRLWLTIGQSERLLLPETAIQRVGQLELVETVAADGTLVRRFVRTGRRDNSRVEILAGLTAGEVVALPSRP